MKPPVPRAWFGLAFFFAFASTVLIRTFWPGVVAALSGQLPEQAAVPVLVLIMLLFGVAVQALWWTIYRAGDF